ncbi:MAG TPA: dCTP deaminase [Verrucomicrobiae bacterium]|jgi:dCTP deaminase|nr:dCTP deaminase [Verrucomicrobiae bacterium]
MILTGPEIETGVANGKIIIRPFRKRQLAPNSYDFRLGNRCCIYTQKILDAAKRNKTRTFTIPKGGLILKPNRIYLMNTEETMGSEHYVPIIRGRSSVGRLGIFIDITADLIDLGSINQWTLQLHAVHPVRVYPGMSIGQVTFWRTRGPRVLYSGKYRYHRSPVPSLAYQHDYE